ncbi:MAG: hypothetical protein WCO06_05600 [Candidatus Roizmanbacteria bacterium]
MFVKRYIPILFLSFLASVAIFLVGINYGSQVEKANKIFKVILNSTPQPTRVIPTRGPITYSHGLIKECNISFLYPDEMSVKITSSSAELTQETKPIMKLWCWNSGSSDPNKLQLPAGQEKEIIFQNNKINGMQIEDKISSQSSNLYFSTSYLNNTKRMKVIVSTDFFPLLETSFKVE